jgi:hypothetical protein
MADAGVRFVRRVHPRGAEYFLANRGPSPVDGWVKLGTTPGSAILLDPRSPDRAGLAAVRHGAASEVYLPFRVRVGGALRPGANTLEIEVTNLAANRVRDLDRHGVPWKTFHDANVVNVDYKPFDASAWPLRDSGLLGPVTLRRLRRIAPLP